MKPAITTPVQKVSIGVCTLTKIIIIISLFILIENRSFEHRGPAGINRRSAIIIIIIIIIKHIKGLCMLKICKIKSSLIQK